MRYIFIVNPVSGNKSGIKSAKVIDKYCKTLGVCYKIIYTKHAKDATRIASSYSDKNTVIYSVGGDGTLNEVINGMVNKDSYLHVVPIGSGNDFYKSIKEYPTNKIDVGKVNNKYFINIASVGIDAKVALDAIKLKEKNVPSSLIYVVSLIYNLFRFKNINLNIDNINTQITLLTICNGRYYGGGFKIAPTAKLDNNLFDVYTFETHNKLDLLKALYKLLKGTHMTDKNVNFTTLNQILIDSDIDLICNLDGEIIKSKKFDFSVINNSINYKINDELHINKVLKLEK